jgi:hypothetical protein
MVSLGWGLELGKNSNFIFMAYNLEKDRGLSYGWGVGFEWFGVSLIEWGESHKLLQDLTSPMRETPNFSQVLPAIFSNQHVITVVTWCVLIRTSALLRVHVIFSSYCNHPNWAYHSGVIPVLTFTTIGTLGTRKSPKTAQNCLFFSEYVFMYLQTFFVHTLHQRVDWNLVG